MQCETALRVLYLYKMLLRYADVDHPLSTNEILQLFEKLYGLQIHRTSVSKYVALLCQSGIEVTEIRSRSKSYYVSDRLFDLPELKLLIDAVQAARFISSKKSQSLIEKITSLASETNQIELKRNLINTSKVKSENEKTYYIIDAINTAINTGKKISFYYTEYNSRKEIVIKNNGRPYCISPYSLIWNGDYYYVVGYYEERGRIHTFRIDRIAKQPEILVEDAYPAPIDFDGSEYALKVFQMFDTYKSEDVDLIVENSLMKYIVDQFGSDVRVAEFDDARFIAHVNVSASPNFFRWVFGWGGRIIISSPENVIRQYHNMINSVKKSQECLEEF